MRDRELKLISGWPALAAVLATPFAVGGLIWYAADSQTPLLIAPAGLLALAWLIALFGFIVNNPNEARVIQLFGNYVGTLRDVGFFYGNPFYTVTKVSMRVRTFETGTSQTDEVKEPGTGKVLVPASQSRRPSKVNDRDGTPIEIAAVVTWKVVTPAEAVFNVDKFEEFVHVQSEAALRNLASRYHYDGAEPDGLSLRGHIDEVAAQLRQDLTARTTEAGIAILDARISYLAYAPEIAAAMLQRQQAGAVVAARSLIVEGAVGMVEQAVEELTRKGLIDADPAKRTAMVGNLLVVLCGHAAPQPVLNAGV